MPADPAPAAAAVPGAGVMLPRAFRVASAHRDTQDTVTLDLDSVDGAGLAFTPGQFTMLHAFGVGEVPISISGDPAHPERLVHTIRDVGGVTRALAGAQPGDVVGVRGPYGVGWDVSSGVGGDVLIVAGGIGLAPLRPVVYEVLGRREQFRRVNILYGARTPEDLLFDTELEQWAVEPDVDVWVTVDRASSAWAGRVGLVTELLSEPRFDPAGSLALLCGPEVMMRYVAAALQDHGLPIDRIRLSLERNMRCGVGLCGHCQLRQFLICVDGPVFGLDQVRHLMAIREL
jgi:NAD(P)H-flavin reductase